MNLNHLPKWRTLEPKYSHEIGAVTPEELPKVLNLSVNELELSARGAHCIGRVRLYEIWKLCVLPDADLLQIDGMGKKSLDEIRGRCYCFPGYSPQFEKKLAKEFWLWAANAGCKERPSTEQKILFVSLLLAWPELEATVKKIQSE